MEPLPEFGSLSDGELKAMIGDLEQQERDVSYQRRLLHGKIDILRAELVARLEDLGRPQRPRPGRRRPPDRDPHRQGCASVVSVVYCSECGFQNPEAANYCSRCGALLSKGEAVDRDDADFLGARGRRTSPRSHARAVTRSVRI